MSDDKQKTDAQWREILTPEQYAVCRQKGTERAFTGQFWDKWDEGAYKCVCCGEALFVSETKFDAGCGWPSFDKPVERSQIGYHEMAIFLANPCPRLGGCVGVIGWPEEHQLCPQEEHQLYTPVLY